MLGEPRKFLESAAAFLAREVSEAPLKTEETTVNIFESPVAFPDTLVVYTRVAKRS